MQGVLVFDLVHLLVSDEQVFTTLGGFVTSFKKNKKMIERSTRIFRGKKNLIKLTLKSLSY